MDVTGAHPVKTVFLVTPSNDASDPAWAFVSRHIEAMEALCERVIVITAADEPLESSSVASSSVDTRSVIEDVYAGRDHETVIVVLDDISRLAQVRSEFGDRVPVLWWSSQVPTAKVIAAAGRWADAMVALALPEDGTGGLTTLVVGAGLELPTVAPAIPDQLPLQLLALGRTAPSKGLTTAVRAVAMARSNGIDARLRIIGPATDAVEHSYRLALSELIRDIALTSVVTIHDAIPPTEVPAAIADAHALIDASVDGDLRHASLEAFAAGRPVFTSNKRLLQLLQAEELALDFEPGDPGQLAQRIGNLAELWPANVAALAGAVHTSLADEHGRSSLAPQWARAIEEVRDRAASRRAAAVSEPSMNGGGASEPTVSPTADAERFSLITEEIALEPAGAVAAFLDAWAHRDPERALTNCAPGAFRFGTATDGTGEGVPLADHLYWAAQTADDLVTTIDDVDVIDDRTVVTVRRDRWTIGDDELEVVVRSLFELEDGLITEWSETELRPTPLSFETPTSAAAPLPTAAASEAALATSEADVTHTTVPPPSVPAGDDVVRSPEEELERAEEQIHHWRRQAIVWRERALEARALGEAYKSNVDDLRVIVEVLKRQSALPPTPGAHPADALRAYETTADDADPDSISWTPDDLAPPTVDDAPAPAPATDPGPAPAPGSSNRSFGAPDARTRRRQPETFVEMSTRLVRQFTRSLGKR
jgi:glycosyltransferase involved in cell wall biosynthesis/limonene-1,2-epoxide hydrolase